MAISCPRPPKVPDLLRVVKKHLDEGAYLDTRHAMQRKRERNITLPEIITVLRNGYHEKHKDEFKEQYNAWNYAVRGKTVDGRQLRACVSFDEPGMLLITAIDLD
jgi:hypothetical protein